jgi:peptide/nickel transport system substrate-binding protein
MSRKRMSRRDFLVCTGVGAVATLAACAAPATPAPTATSAAPAPTAVPAQPTAVPPTATTAPTKAPTIETPKMGGTYLDTSATADLIWDPFFTNLPSRACRCLYDRPFAYRGKDITMPEPSLVESFTEDDASITMKFRQGVKFHNGREMTAEDIVANVTRASDKSIGHQLTDTFTKVDKAEVVDKYTVKMTWKTPYALKREDLTKLFIIAPEGMAGVNKAPAGSGPWKLGTYEPGNKVSMVKNADYWQKPCPYMDGYQIKFIDDPQARVANLEGEQVDQVMSMPYADVARLKQAGKLQFAESPRGGLWYIFALQLKVKPFDNKLVRQAMNYACDHKKIVKLAFSDLVPATRTRYVPGNFWYVEKADKYYTFDLNKAKALLTQAGYPNGFDTEILSSEAVLPGTRAACQIYAQDLASIGVNVKIDDQPSDVYYARYPKYDFKIIAMQTGDGRADPSPSLDASSFYRATNNRCSIEVLSVYDQYVQLIKDLGSTSDMTKRKATYEQIEMIIADESWAITYADMVVFYGLGRRVRNFTVAPPDTYIQYHDIWLAS